MPWCAGAGGSLGARSRRSTDACAPMNEAVKNRELKETIAQDYEWGFVSDIEQEFAPKGLSEDTVRFISAKKDEPEWMLDWRLKAYRAWLEMEEVSWAKLDIPRDRLPGRLLLRRAQGEAQARVAGRARSRNPPHLREARHPDRGAEGARRRRRRAQGRGRRGVRQRQRRHHLPRGAEEGRASSSSPSPKRSASIPSW